MAISGAQQIEALMAAFGAPPGQSPAQGDVRDDLFTQILNDDDYHLETQKYARPFAPGLVQVLIIDTPATTIYVSDDQLDGFPFGIDEAYQIGQANTDAAGYDQIIEVGGGIYQALGGESVVTAAKLGNITELCSDAKISPAKGVLFIPLHRSNILFAEFDPAKIGAFQQISEQGWAAVKDERGALTKDIYGWRPDGGIARMRDGATTTPAAQQSATPAPSAPSLKSAASGVTDTGAAARKETALNSTDPQVLRDLMSWTVPSETTDAAAAFTLACDIAQNDATPPDMLHWLYDMANDGDYYDPDQQLKCFIAMHPNTKVEILRTLAQDPNTHVRKWAMETLAEHQPPSNPRTAPAAQPATTRQPAFCTECGGGLPTGSNFCGSCGSPVVN